jgi:hypothetical protein
MGSNTTENRRVYAPRTFKQPDHGLTRLPPIKGTKRGCVLGADHAAVREVRTLFPTTVKFVEETIHVLKSGVNSRKIGSHVMKGAWKGFPIFTLTLQERATCPKACQHWLTCYGNNMHLAERLHHDVDFEEVLWLELEALNKAFPLGYVVRLHVLGDFYSVGYVKLWERALLQFPALNVWGYTARDPGDPDEPIGRELKRLSDHYWSRFAMRFSGKDWGLQGAITVEKGEKAPGAITCPVQTGKTATCGTCALCWTTKATIAFERH